VVTQTNLLRQGNLAYFGGWWNANLMAQSYQTLQDPNAPPVAIPYRRLPQLTVTAARPDLPQGLAFNFAGEYVRFHHPDAVRANRTVFYPQLSLPLQTSAFSLTPKLGLHMTRYQLERQAAGVPDQITRQLPILSVDSSVVFERDTAWFGKTLTQTLEPRLYYLYAPKRDQSQIPVFDSALVDFNFAQIFGENRYGGSDRVGDANQLTAAVVSRLLDPTTGAELMRGMLGQRFYFTTQHVTLPGEVARDDRKTDLLAAFSGYVMPRTHLDAGWQYNPSRSRTERLNVGGRYQPEVGKVLNAGYRYTRDQLGQVDLSAQWPLGGGWHGVGRYNYSTKERRVVESVAGLEYDGGCWAARVVVQRLAVQLDKASSALFFQLELNGLSRIGSSPLDILKRNIPGYGIINQPTADPIFAAY
jgi:LPS-assembly protein